jgi:dipeptidyl aminopeptidase/acylaminoacyl peptidase
MKKRNVTAPTGYQKPDPIVGKIVRADSFSIPLFNHAKTALVKRFGEDLPPIHYVARPQLKLGGLRFNPNNYAFISNYYFKRLVYFDVKTRKEKEIVFPKNSILRETLWSPDGKHLVVSLEKDFEQEVWLVQIPSLKKTKIPGVQLNSVLGRTIEWVGSTRLLIGTRTKNQVKPISLEKRTPTGPVIQESGGVVSQNRTYPDLIKTPEDEKLFAQAIEQQLVIYDLKTRKKKNLGKPGFFGRISLSPNYQWLLIDTFQLPFSKVVPVSLFAKKTEVWNLSGKVIHAFKPNGPFENLPIEGVQTGPRSIQWIGSEPESLFYAEALDQGDWAVKADHRDELFKLTISSKVKAKPQSLFKMKNRYAGFNYFDEADSYWLTDYERDRQWVTNLWLKKNADQQWEAKTIFSINENDAYGDPGDPVMTRNALGHPVIALDRRIPNQKAIFLRGTGSSPEGDRPFLRRFDLETLQTEEWFRSEKGAFERFVGFTNETYSEFITAFESQTQSPHYLIRKPNDAKTRLLYGDPNPYKLLSQLKKEVITYTRNDGVKLSGILYYPLNYEEGKKYPAIIQAYPLEYTDASTAGQVRGSQDKFSTPYHEDMIYNALRGYFVLDETQMPIIGHPETKNDTFVEQLVASAQAAVDALVDRGLVDPKRVGVVGHSYGAYMVANLLTHSQLFAAGIAKSGAYNRTLTPFGFQGERRPLWKAKETYLKMSPFLAADQVKTPILLIHGMADNNTGTFPMQTERYFEALKGQGAQTRMVLLPEESHGYASIESVEHVLYEVFRWFDLYLGES